ncbi:MAG: GNAT family N-acetyltransferase [Chloroflexota bacterium]
MIQSIGKADIKTWWEIVKKDQNATFYHTPAWLEVAQCNDDKYADASLMGTFSSGTNFLFPLVSYIRQWPFKRLYSVYDYCYGGLIADGPVSAAEHQAVLKALPLNQFSSFNLTVTPGVSTANRDPLPEFEVGTYTSSILNLEGLTFEEALAGYSSSHRRNYRKAVKAGITVRKADTNRIHEELAIFYEIYLDTLENRWGDDMMALVISEPFLNKLGELVQRYPENICLWFAELDGKAISAEIDFVWNGRLDSWTPVSRPEYFKMMPTLALFSGIIKNAIDIGVTTFDFGPNLGKQSLQDFKRRFGSETVEYNTWERPSPALQLVDKMRR